MDVDGYMVAGQIGATSIAEKIDTGGVDDCVGITGRLLFAEPGGDIIIKLVHRRSDNDNNPLGSCLQSLGLEQGLPAACEVPGACCLHRCGVVVRPISND